MAYTAQSEILSRLPERFLIEALDDDGDGIADPEAWEAVANGAATEIDGLLGMRFSTPFPAPVPAVVAAASLILIMEALYDRRGMTGKDNNPYYIRAEEQRATLRKIGAGDMPLTPTIQKATPTVRAITEPARTSSAHGHLST